MGFTYYMFRIIPSPTKWNNDSYPKQLFHWMLIFFKNIVLKFCTFCFGFVCIFFDLANTFFIAWSSETSCTFYIWYIIFNQCSKVKEFRHFLAVNCFLSSFIPYMYFGVTLQFSDTYIYCDLYIYLYKKKCSLFKSSHW